MIATLVLREGNLKKIRRWTGLETNDALAQAVGIDPGNLSRILRGKQTPGGKFIASLCKALDADLDDLFEVVDSTPGQAAA